MIFSGQNNHEWKLTTPRLKEVLETVGRFEVTVTDHPEQCDGGVLKKYDVLLSNWNTFGSPPVTNWPEVHGILGRRATGRCTAFQSN